MHSGREQHFTVTRTKAAAPGFCRPTAAPPIPSSADATQEGLGSAPRRPSPSAVCAPHGRLGGVGWGRPCGGRAPGTSTIILHASAVQIKCKLKPHAPALSKGDANLLFISSRAAQASWEPEWGQGRVRGAASLRHGQPRTSTRVCLCGVCLGSSAGRPCMPARPRGHQRRESPSRKVEGRVRWTVLRQA